MTMMPPALNAVPYRNRRAAGQCLAQALAGYEDLGDILVLAIPPGGAEIAEEVAQLLGAELDVFIVAPIRSASGVCVGTLASGGVCVLHQDALRRASVDPTAIADTVVRVREGVLQREQFYRAGRQRREIADRNVVLVADGAASGRLIRSALAALRSYAPTSVTVALPVASADALAAVTAEADETVCPHVPDPFYAIGLAYERYPELDDMTVRACLERIRAAAAEPAEAAPLELDGAR